jgi:hypothetical protein
MSPIFQRLLCEGDKSPANVVLMPFVDHAFKPRCLSVPFKLSVSSKAPLTLGIYIFFQFKKWHHICKTRFK